MSAISAVFERCKAEGRAALIPFLVAGDPLMDATARFVAAAAQSGADLIELGIPYSDPLADGPTIQRASQRALHGGATLDAALAMAARLDRTIVNVPLIAFTYYNPLFVRGLERAARDLVAAGFSGVVMPDLPPDEAEEAADVFAQAGAGISFLIAPTTPAERAANIGRLSADFAYVVSRMGVTGASRSVHDDLAARVAALRRVVAKPLAVGFGITTPEQAAGVAAFADGVIVGSALIDRIDASANGEQEAAVRSYCATLAAAVIRGPNMERRASTRREGRSPE